MYEGNVVRIVRVVLAQYLSVTKLFALAGESGSRRGGVNGGVDDCENSISTSISFQNCGVAISKASYY